ncbi:MAG: PKD domain-containing protein [Desulfobacteraceae bacterium]
MIVFSMRTPTIVKALLILACCCLHQNAFAVPVVRPDTDLAAAAGETIRLNDSTGRQTPGEMAQYPLRRPRKLKDLLENATTAASTFQAPSHAESEFVSRVTDGGGNSAASQSVIVAQGYSPTLLGSGIPVIRATDTNQAPVADAGPDGSATEQLFYRLDADASHDADGSIATYLWEQISGPPVTVEYGSFDNSYVSIQMPEVEQDTEIGFRLTVTDDEGLSATDEITILVLENLPPQPVPIPTQAVVGGEYHVMVATDLFTCQPSDAIASGSYRWRQVSGPPVVLQYRKGTKGFFREIARILTPQVESLTPLVFEISAADRLGLVSTNTITINVITPAEQAENVLPIADAGEDRVSIGSDLSAYLVFDGSGSYDPDGEIVSYEWELIEGPEGWTPSSLHRKSDADPTNYVILFNSSAQPGDYRARLTVTDNRGGASSDDLIVTVPSFQMTGERPRANAGADGWTSLYYFHYDDDLELDGSKSTDADGDIVSYHWQQIGGPRVEIANANGSKARFIPALIQSYITYNFLLTVVDNDGNRHFDRMSWTVGYRNSLPKAFINQRDLIGLSGGTLRLDGTLSYDPDSYISAFNWTQLEGPDVVFLDSSVEPLLQLPELDPERGLQRFRVHLSVTDLDGDESKETHEMYYWIVHPDWDSQALDSGADRTVIAGDSVEIVGQSLLSDDCDNFNGCVDHSKGLMWVLLDGPEPEEWHSTDWTLSFTAPQVTERSTMTWALIKTVLVNSFSKQKYLSYADPVKVHLLPAGQALTADAGEDQEAVEGTIITLDGIGSNDPHGTIEYYHWQQLEGPDAALSAAGEMVTQVALPTLAEQADLLFQLTVVNDWGLEAVDTVRVSVTPDLADGDIDGDGVPDEHDRFPRDPNESYDVDGDGIGDNSDTDIDGDGIANGDDVYPNDPRDLSPPQLTVLEPADGADIDTDHVIVRGTIAAPDGTGVIVNGLVADRGDDGREFIARVPLGQGSNELQITATTLSRKHVSQTLTVNRSGESPVTFFVSEQAGFAPMESRFRFYNGAESPTVQVDLDYDGDGGIDETLVDNFERDLRYTYTEEGLYTPRMTLTDEDGVQHTVTQLVNVVAQDRFIDRMENLWTQMNSALSGGNLGLALEHIDTTHSEMYKKLFRYLLPEMPEVIESYSQLYVNHLAADHASFHVVRTIDGENYVFTICFNRDVFGVWRIYNM